MTNISSIASAARSVTQSTAATPPTTTAGSGAGQGDGFSSLLGEGVRQAGSLEAQAQSSVMDLLRGGGTEVHDAMIATQQSELTFELALQVRNKAVQAYQQMMQMQF